MIKRERDPTQVKLEQDVFGKLAEIVNVNGNVSPSSSPNQINTIGVEEALRELLTIFRGASGDSPQVS
jgi:hypothetical protein